MDRWRSNDDFGSRFKRSGTFNADSGVNSKRGRFGVDAPPAEPIMLIKNIPFGITGEYVMGFLNHMIHYTGIAQAPGDPVLAFKMNMDMGMGLFKFRSLVEAKQTLNTLDRVPFKGSNLELRPYVEDEGGSGPYPNYQGNFRPDVRSQSGPFFGADRRKKFGPSRNDRPPRRDKGSHPGVRGGDSQESQLDPARTLYVGNVKEKGCEMEVRKFLNEQMHSKDLVKREGDPISLGSDLPNFYSFQVRSADEATKALNLHGAEFKSRKLVLRRPREYYTLQGKSDTISGIHYDVTHRIYVGNIPPNTTEDELREFLDDEMHKREYTNSEGDSILPGPLSRKLNYFFIEFRSSEEATEALTLDGIEFKGQALKIKRPANYRAPGSKAPSRSSEEKDASWLLASWNIGDIRDEAKQSEIDHALVRMSIDVAALQKTQLATGSLSTEHYKWYLSGDEGEANGVAFLVNKKHEELVTDWKSHNGHIASIHFKASLQTIAMFSVLIPPAEDDQMETLMSQLEKLVLQEPPEHHILVLGDFSAEIGKEDISEEDGQWLGPSLLHTHDNENGKRLKTFMNKCCLFLDTTRGSSTVVTLVTGKESSQVDHILTNCKSLIKWIRSTTLGDHGTDHKVLRAAMHLTHCNEHPVEARDDYTWVEDKEDGGKEDGEKDGGKENGEKKDEGKEDGVKEDGEKEEASADS